MRNGNPQESRMPQEGLVQQARGCEALPRGNVSGRLSQGSAFRRQVWAARHCLETVPWESPPARGSAPRRSAPAQGCEALPRGSVSGRPSRSSAQGGLVQHSAARHSLEAVPREGPANWKSTRIHKASRRLGPTSPRLRGTASRQCLGEALPRQCLQKAGLGCKALPGDSALGKPSRGSAPRRSAPAPGCEALPRGSVSGRPSRGSAQGGLVQHSAARHSLEAVPQEGPLEAVACEIISG